MSVSHLIAEMTNAFVPLDEGGQLKRQIERALAGMGVSTRVSVRFDDRGRWSATCDLGGIENKRSRVEALEALADRLGVELVGRSW